MIPCYTDEVMAALRSEDPEAFDRAVALDDANYERYLFDRSRINSNSRASCDVYIIPIVFHVVYATTASNISDATILAQLEVFYGWVDGENLVVILKVH